MPACRSRTTTGGNLRMGARASWRATGLTDDDFGKPIVAVVNSFVEFVPGHVRLRDLGRLVGGEIRKAGGGPGMQEMLKPTGLLKARGLARTCALVTDGRFSGAASGLSIGHVSPEAELSRRREAMTARGKSAWQPSRPRQRLESKALRAYARFATSAAFGAVRDVDP